MHLETPEHSATAFPIAAIRRDPELNFRERVDDDTILEYAEAMKDGAAFPAVTVFYDGDHYWLADGFHRVAGAELAGREEIAVVLCAGTRRLALLHAAGSNAEHGLRRTAADKQAAVKAVLADTEWSKRSDRWIAKKCHVSRPFVARLRKGDLIARLKSSKSVEWYTPPPFLDAARAVMGAIDLDPASCEAANENVQAEQFYTVADDGLERPWFGRVWCNPPYGKHRGESMTGLFTFKLIGHYDAQDVTEACLLIGANTDTAHFQACREHPVCFPAGRIQFINGLDDDHNGHENTQGHAVIYMGANVARFREVFEQFGPVYSTKW